ncbi:zinc finger BED domain-containing protein 4 isoform X2 [Hoplias malabaricus]|uniref:zinc finger BED domain-containing protein 4 isoform X2 n=1 Tax=Hoplias malabaricus TaxID=27720 RepID=UPI003462049E
MDKRRFNFDMRRSIRGRGSDSTRFLPFKRKYKPRHSTHTERDSYTEQYRHSDLRRREQHQQQQQDQMRATFRTCVLNMIIMDLQTLSLVEEEGFQRFVNYLHPCPDTTLTASWIRTELLEMYEHVKLKVQKELCWAKDLTLSAELWISGKDESYLTVTGHFISENWELKSYVLETAHLLGEHTPEKVHQELWRISTEWKISEKIHVVVVNVDGMKKVKSKARWTYMPCFGHTLQKVFREAMDNPGWRDLLKKCQHVVAFVHQKTTDGRHVQLSQSLSVDWLPVLTMLEKITDNWETISEVLSDNLNEELWLNERELRMLGSMVIALREVKDILREMGKSGYSSVSSIIPLSDKLQYILRGHQQNGNKVAQRISEKYDHHIGNIKQNQWFTLSTALDPNFKGSVLHHTGAEVIKMHIRNEMHKLRSGSNSREEGAEDLILQRYTESGTTTLSPLKFWAAKKELKELPFVARKYLTVVSTAIPMERVTQQEKSWLISNRRKCLELEDINMMLFLNNNHQTVNSSPLEDQRPFTSLCSPRPGHQRSSSPEY